jgi:hypothetical protein
MLYQRKLYQQYNINIVVRCKCIHNYVSRFCASFCVEILRKTIVVSTTEFHSWNNFTFCSTFQKVSSFTFKPCSQMWRKPNPSEDLCMMLSGILFSLFINDTFGKRKKIVLSMCHLLINMTNG